MLLLFTATISNQLFSLTMKASNFQSKKQDSWPSLFNVNTRICNQRVLRCRKCTNVAVVEGTGCQVGVLSSLSIQC